MYSERLKNYTIILASGSPRRQQFFKDMDIAVEIRPKEVVEDYPDTLIKSEITDYLSQKKAIPIRDTLRKKDILITSDTIVWHCDKALGKPENEQEAFNMLMSLSGDSHEVITSVCFTTVRFQKTVHAVTKVYFKPLTEEELWYYIKNYKPFDKAGAYGIQEWIGYTGIEKIEGSYFNVAGLPTHLVYRELNAIVTTNS